jgi:hypothetical protein
MRALISVVTAVLVMGCTPAPKAPAQAKAVHVASAKDTAFIREQCAMPDSVLAGTRPCIDRVQSSKIRVF